MNKKNLIYIAVGVGVLGLLYMKNKNKAPKQVLKKADVKEDDFGESATMGGGGGGGYMGGTMSAPISTATTPNITINNTTPATSVSPSSSIAPTSLPPRTGISPTAVRPNVTQVMPLPSATLPVRTNFLGFDGDMTNKTRKFDFSTDF
jgi:hypothetical protein